MGTANAPSDSPVRIQLAGPQAPQNIHKCTPAFVCRVMLLPRQICSVLHYLPSVLLYARSCFLLKNCVLLLPLSACAVCAAAACMKPCCLSQGFSLRYGVRRKLGGNKPWTPCRLPVLSVNFFSFGRLW